MIEWNEEQIQLKRAMIDLSRKINANIPEENGFPMGKWNMLCEMGIPALPVEEKYGGLEKDILTTMYLLEAMGYSCDDAGLNFSMASHIVSTEIPIQEFGSEEQKEKYLPKLSRGEFVGAHAITEPGSGSDAFNMKTVAEKKGSKFILNGSKTFISNGPIADVIVVYALTDKTQGALKGVTAFIVDAHTPGLKKGKPLEKLGLKTSPLCELFFDDCEVSEENVLGKVGSGFSLFNYVMKKEILCSFAINLGEMEKQLERCVEYSKTRKQFNQPIGKFQAIAHKIANMKIRYEYSKALLYHAGELVYKKKHAHLEIPIAKIAVSEAYVKSSLDAMQIFGAYGYMADYPIEKYIRDSVGSTIYSGSSEVQRNLIANYLGL